MIREDYVSFETAKLLKEKGFYGECLSMYVTPKPHCGMGNPNEPKIAPHGRDSHYYEGYLYQCEAPTLQVTFKWLREVHNIYIWVQPNSCKEGLHDAHVKEHWWKNTWAGIGYKSYEEAVEAAIKYTLENLI